MTINKRIRHLRETMELGREAFCRKCGIAKDTLIKIEQGKVKTPSYNILQSICMTYPQYTFFLLEMTTKYQIDQIEPIKKRGRKSGTPNKKTTVSEC